MAHPNNAPVTIPGNDSFQNQINQDLKAWLAAQAALKADEKRIQELALMLTHMKNPLYGVQEIMGAVMDMSGDQVSGLAAIDNLDSDLRSGISNAQGSANSIGGGKATKQDLKEAQQMLKILKDIQAFIDKEEKADKKDQVADPASLKTLQNAINQIKSAFGSDWGDPSKMVAKIHSWIEDAKKGKYESGMKTMMNGFQTLTQTVSALSTTTNTRLQFTTEQFKQFMGIDEDSLQAYLKLISGTINNQRTN